MLLGEEENRPMPNGMDESTTGILTIIRDDVKEIRGDVKTQGQQIASISRTQEVQHENLTTMRVRVDQVMDAHVNCPTPRDVEALKKRLSDVSELAKKPSRYTPKDGFKIQIQTQGIWKKALPWLIAIALGGGGIASHYLDWFGTSHSKNAQE